MLWSVLLFFLNPGLFQGFYSMMQVRGNLLIYLYPLVNILSSFWSCTLFWWSCEAIWPIKTRMFFFFFLSCEPYKTVIMKHICTAFVCTCFLLSIMVILNINFKHVRELKVHYSRNRGLVFVEFLAPVWPFCPPLNILVGCCMFLVFSYFSCGASNWLNRWLS